MKLGPLIAGAVMALAPLSAQAHVHLPSEYSADDWYDMCNANLDWHNFDRCYAYVRGVGDSIMALNSDFACIPDGVGDEELTDVGREYIDAYAQQGSRLAALNSRSPPR